MGRLDEAMAAYDRAFELGYPLARQLQRTCDALRAMLPRLPNLIGDQDRSETNAERLAFADLCRQPFVGRYVLAVRLYTAAFRTDPRLSDDVRTGLRYEAAAALAGCGQGRDAAGLDTQAKAQFREQARAWLRAEIGDWAKLLRRNSPADRAAVRQALRVWQRDLRLEGVRDAALLARLPDVEREVWQKLWQDVREIRAQASPGV